MTSRVTGVTRRTTGPWSEELVGEVPRGLFNEAVMGPHVVPLWRSGTSSTLVHSASLRKRRMTWNSHNVGPVLSFAHNYSINLRLWHYDRIQLTAPHLTPTGNTHSQLIGMESMDLVIIGAGMILQPHLRAMHRLTMFYRSLRPCRGKGVCRSKPRC